MPTGTCLRTCAPLIAGAERREYCSQTPRSIKFAFLSCRDDNNWRVESKGELQTHGPPVKTLSSPQGTRRHSFNNNKPGAQARQRRGVRTLSGLFFLYFTFLLRNPEAGGGSSKSKSPQSCVRDGAACLTPQHVSTGLVEAPLQGVHVRGRGRPRRPHLFLLLQAQR